MASSYSALKIELMATGEDDQIWGDKTNQNWLAMQQAISQSGVVNFASADQVLTLVDSSAQQPARAARLVANGTSGGARNLTLPAIDKLTVFENQLADPVTVKVAGGGAGQVVPAGRSMPLLTFATDVHAQFDYLPALTLGGNLTVNGAGSFSGPLNGQPITVGPLPVNYNGMRMDSDGATYSKISFNYGANCYMNYRWSDGYLNLAVNNVQTMGLDASGNAVFPGYVLGATLYAGGNTNGPAIGGSATDSHVYLDINTSAQWYYVKSAGDLYWYQAGNQNAHFAPNGALVMRGSVTAPVVYVGDSSMYLQTDTTASYITLNGFSCRLQYTKAAGSLNYVVNDVNVFNVDLGGSIHTNGNLTCNGAANIASSLTCPDIYPCNTGRFRITGNANQSYIFFDTAGSNQSYMIWDYNSTNFAYVSGGAARFAIAYGGQATFYNGLQVNGAFGCATQGFFTGNLSAAINAGIAANCVMVGFFQSGVWFNMQSVGVNVNTVACTAGYGSGASVNWSCSPSDRRLKDNIERPSLDALDVVRKLPIWSCDYIAPRPNDADLEDPEAWPEIREHWPFSFMADEVDAAMPCATIKNDGLPVALHPQHLIATLWAAVQQLTDRLESAEAKLAAS